MDSVKIVKKEKKLNRKGKLMISLSPEEEKKELVSALMVKCHKTEEEVLMSYEEFYLKHEDGFISKEEYTHSKRVNVDQLSLHLYNSFFFRDSSKQNHCSECLMKITAAP